MLTTHWAKAKASLANGNCVEVRLAFGAVQLRDGKNPTGPSLLINKGDWVAFLATTAKPDAVRAW